MAKLIEPADWLEGGEDAPHRRKDALLAADAARVWGELDGSRAGQAEAATMVREAAGGALDIALPPLLAAACFFLPPLERCNPLATCAL